MLKENIRNKQNFSDIDGYRPNVGIVILNGSGKVLWARRARRDGWQFPQGGVEDGETAEEAVYRELFEEVGLLPQNVQLVGRTRDWLHYDVPGNLRSQHTSFKGQKQLWFLMKLLSSDDLIKLDQSDTPEFDRWKWVDYWLPVKRVIFFKRTVYKTALKELERLIKVK